MANFIILVDPDPARRQACLRAAVPALEVYPEARAASCGGGSFIACWASSECSPCSVQADAQGAGVVLGDAFDPHGRVIRVAELRRAWSNVPVRLPPSWDGFHVAASYTPDGLVAGVDRLGLFPLYYWTAPDIVMLAASPAAFHAHPLFEARFNPFGACGILMTGGLIDGETVWRDVRRLRPGHLLTWSRRAGAREVPQYTLPLGLTRTSNAFDDDVTRLAQTLECAVMRQAQQEHSIGLLLSGGRDSRLVAGILQRNGRTARALTLGDADDHEVLGGSAVAASLGFSHEVRADPLDDVETLVSRHVQLEQLSNGMANFHTWGMLPLVAPLGDRLYSGYLLDALIGGTWRQIGAKGQSDSAAPLLSALTAYGIAPERLRRLLRPDMFGSAVDEVLARVRRGFDELPGDANDRAWQYLLLTRGRHHAGSAFWRLTMSTWPVAVLLGNDLTDTVASLSPAALVDRRAEDALLCSRFPELARLPLDRNSDDTSPLKQSRMRRFTQRLGVFGSSGRSVERRRYYRLYDINSDAWRTVRRMAERGRGRERVGDVFDAGELNTLLPAPDERIELADPIRDSNGLKALLGLLLWWQRHA